MLCKCNLLIRKTVEACCKAANSHIKKYLVLFKNWVASLYAKRSLSRHILPSMWVMWPGYKVFTKLHFLIHSQNRGKDIKMKQLLLSFTILAIEKSHPIIDISSHVKEINIQNLAIKIFSLCFWYSKQSDIPLVQFIFWYHSVRYINLLQYSFRNQYSLTTLQKYKQFSHSFCITPKRSKKTKN